MLLHRGLILRLIRSLFDPVERFCVTFRSQFSGNFEKGVVIFINANKCGPGIFWCCDRIGALGDGSTNTNFGFGGEDGAVVVKFGFVMVVVFVIVVCMAVGCVSPEPIIDRGLKKAPIVADLATGNLAPIGLVANGFGGEFEICGECFKGEDGRIHGE
jgi:hypothetical protein